MTNKSESVTVALRFDKMARQTVGDITKITGMVHAKYLIGIIDKLNLDANPREAKTGLVTSAIQDSIEHDALLFPYKTKGVLLAASAYQELGNGRFSLTFNDPSIEGILDGGHNMLAIGLYILRKALENDGQKLPAGSKTWNEFKQLWLDNRSVVDKYQKEARQDPAVFNDPNDPSGELSFYVPVELIVPSDPENDLSAINFRSDLYEISEARNNNAELTASAKANQKGYFDELAKLLAEENPLVAERVEWKTNDGGDIKAQDIIALSWIVLRVLTPVTDAKGKKAETPAAPNLYRSKGSCLTLFERFMSSPEVTISSSSDYKAEIRNARVYKAFKLAVQLPTLYDLIYEKLPELYNAANGRYGRIVAVKNVNKPSKSGLQKTTPFSGLIVDTASPEGFVTPLVYGLTELVDPETLEWREDPKAFLDKWLPKLVERYAQLLAANNYDPQKMGKTRNNYSTVCDYYKLAIAGIL